MKSHIHISKKPTDRSSEHFDLFLSDIGKQQLLSAEEEVALCEKCKAWDDAAIQELVEKNLRFVVSVAKQYQYRWVPLPDLINEGSIWLIKAAHKFDPTKGFKFISYAVRWIGQAMQDAIYKQAKIVRLPVNQTNDIYKLLKMTSKLEQQLERLPTQEELATALEMDIDDLKYIQQLANTSTDLLDDFTDGQETSSFIDNFHLGDENNTDQYIHQESTTQTVTHLLSLLQTDMQKICKMKYGIAPYTHEHTYEEIAEKFDTTVPYIKRLLEKSISYLHRYQKNHNENTMFPSIPTDQQMKEIVQVKLQQEKSFMDPQRVNIVQMFYCFPPYTHKYTKDEIANKLGIPLYLITYVLQNTTQKILNNPDIAPTIHQLLSTFKKEDQTILEMKYGLGSSPRTHYTDIELAHKANVRVLHVKYLINTFEHKLRNIICWCIMECNV